MEVHEQPLAATAMNVGHEQGHTKPSRRDRRHRDTRREILQAARELLREVGLDDLTLRKVAERADFSPASLYTYFASREEILVALREESLELLYKYAQRIPRGLPPDRRVVELGMAYIEFGCENPIDLQCILGVSDRRFARHDDDSIGLEVARYIGNAFREGASAGIFAATDRLTPAEMAYGLWAMVQGLVSVGSVDLDVVAGDVSAAPRRVLEAYVAGLMARPPAATT